MTATAEPRSRPRLQADLRRFTAVSGVTLLATIVVSVFLMPLAYMVATAFKERTQLTAPGAPIWLPTVSSEGPAGVPARSAP